MKSIETHMLHVHGATLFYEVRGKGPILLLISGGGNDARSFDALVQHLVEEYTVVTYDRRGISRSELEDPREEQHVETHSNDAHCLLKELGSEYEPAFVFGSSGGAVIGLDLVARHPEQIYTLIAHEPPGHFSVKSDPIQEMLGIREVYRSEGMTAALQLLMAQPGLQLDDRETDAGRPEQTPERNEYGRKNLSFFFEHEVAMYDCYQPDFAAIKAAMSQASVLIAGGESQQSMEYWSAIAAAEKLGSGIVAFPGHHVGYVTRPRAFAQRLREVLSETSRG